MGVTILQPFPTLENKTGSATIEFLTKRILTLGAVPQGQFLVDCETFHSTQHMGNAKAIHILHNSEYPASVFAMLDNGTKLIPLVADSLFDLVILKMTGAYTSKKQTKIESKGQRFELGDFLVKLGSVTMNQTFKGVMVEVEYRPCVIAANCWDLLREFMQGFMGSQVSNAIPAFFNTPSITNPSLLKINDVFQPIDTVNLYLDHFSNYRKQVKAVVAGARS